MTDTFALLLKIICSVFTVSSTRILLNPSSISSHVIYFSTLGRKLAEEGHQVTVLVGSNVRIPKYSNLDSKSGSFEFFIYPAKNDQPSSDQPEMSKLMLEVALAKSSWSRFWKAYRFEEETKLAFEEECLDVIGNKDLIKSLRKLNFQFVIVDFIAPECYYVLPLLLRVPFGTFSIPVTTWIFRVPRLPSFTPFFSDFTTDRMTFYERLCTFLREVGLYYIYSSIQENPFVKKYLLEADLDGESNEFDYKSSNIVDCSNEEVLYLDGMGFLQQTRMWLFLEDLSVSFPNALMPNTMSIGDVMVKDVVEKLPVGPLANFVEKFNKMEGCVLVSYGSFFNQVPETILEKYCQLFKHFKKRLGFIWKLNKPLEMVCPNADNIFIQDWLPQNDLLAHECVKLFITHAGLNSVIESVNHKKPMIVVPLGIDQISNAAMAVEKGYALTMPLSRTFSIDEFIENIEKIIAPNSIYKRNVELYSAVLKDKPAGVGKRVGWLIENVMKYGDGHLRNGAFQLNTLQFFMFDIFFAFIVIFILIILLTICFFMFMKWFTKFIYYNLISKKEKIN